MIKTIEIIEFNNKNGFTFVFTTEITCINNKVASAEINPTGIIYTQDNEYYFAPLCENYNIKKIIKEYVKEEEYVHFQQ